jgi:hypothetical protein
MRRIQTPDLGAKSLGFSVLIQGQQRTSRPPPEQRFQMSIAICRPNFQIKTPRFSHPDHIGPVEDGFGAADSLFEHFEHSST